MKFQPTLIEGILIKRYKRFLADVELTSGEIITAHTANTGAMTGCAEPGSRVWLSLSDNPKRKYAHTWEMVEILKPSKRLVGINTHLSNRLVQEAIEAGKIVELAEYDSLSTEVRYGEENSRIDLLLQSSAKDLPDCYIEVKNVTLFDGETAYFPDAVTQRGTKHLRELDRIVEQGNRAIIFYCVQSSGVTEVRPAAHIDAKYTETFKQVITKGVEAMAYDARLSADEIVLNQAIPVKV